MDLIAVQWLLGHRHIASTMSYVRPSQTFIEDAWRRVTDSAVRAFEIVSRGTAAAVGGRHG
ncbi:hypothetical protein ACWGN9_27485 [Streptomyces sp. NPDC055775]